MVTLSGLFFFTKSCFLDVYEDIFIHLKGLETIFSVFLPPAVSVSDDPVFPIELANVVMLPTLVDF